MLLPVFCLLRRADVVEVIGAALVAAAAGWGHRRIGLLVRRPHSTVRGWLRRFSARAGPVREAFTALACALVPAPGLPEPAGCEIADALAAIAAAGAAARSRWGESLFTVSAWRLAAAVTSGQLLAARLPAEWINTSRPW